MPAHTLLRAPTLEAIAPPCARRPTASRLGETSRTNRGTPRLHREGSRLASHLDPTPGSSPGTTAWRPSGSQSRDLCRVLHGHAAISPSLATIRCEESDSGVARSAGRPKTSPPPGPLDCLSSADTTEPRDTLFASPWVAAATNITRYRQSVRSAQCHVAHWPRHRGVDLSRCQAPIEVTECTKDVQCLPCEVATTNTDLRPVPGASTTITAGRPAGPACSHPPAESRDCRITSMPVLNLGEGADRELGVALRFGARYPSRAGANMQFRRDTGWAKRTITRMRAPIIASAMTSRAFVQSMVQFAQVLPIIPGFAPNWRNIAHSPGPTRPGQHPQGILPNAITCSRNNP